MRFMCECEFEIWYLLKGKDKEMCFLCHGWTKDLTFSLLNILIKREQCKISSDFLSFFLILHHGTSRLKLSVFQFNNFMTEQFWVFDGAICLPCNSWLFNCFFALLHMWYSRNFVCENIFPHWVQVGSFLWHSEWDFKEFSIEMIVGKNCNKMAFLQNEYFCVPSDDVAWKKYDHTLYKYKVFCKSKACFCLDM